MQTKSWALAAAFAFALSGVSAEPIRPKIYYPRQVRRQVDNDTEPQTTSTKRQLLDGLLDPILGGGDSSEPAKSTTKDGPSDSSGILVGPTGIVVPGLIGDDNDNNNGNGGGNGNGNGTATATGDNSAQPEPTSTKGGLLDPIVNPLPTLISDVLGPGKTTSSKTSETSSAGNDDKDENSKTQDPEPTSTKGGLLDPIVDPLPTLISDVLPGPSKSKTEDPKPTGGAGNGTDPSQNPEPTREPTSTKGGLLDPIVDPLPTLITDILPGPSKSKDPEPEPTGGPGNGTDPTSKPGNIITDILPSLTLFPPSPEPTETTQNDPPTDPSETSKPPLIPTDILPTVSLPPILPDPSDTTSPPPGPTDGPGNGTTTDVPDVPTPIPTPIPTPGESTSIQLPPPAQNETSAPPPESETAPTVLPTETNTPVPTPTPPQTPSSAPEEPSSASQPPPSPPSETVIPTTQPPKPPVTSVEPTATYSNPDDWMPTSIVADPTSFTWERPTGTEEGPTSTGLPTDIPKVILPNKPRVEQPEGTKEIQIGFYQPMNYMHVAKTPIAAAQIFMFLPKALSFAGDFKIDKVEVIELVPLDTKNTLGYVTTIAKVWYPESLLDKLQTDLWEPQSDLYNNPESLVRDLTVDINPDIDIFGNISAGDDDEDDSKPEDGDNSSNDALDSGSDDNSSAKEKATKAGIAVGAFGLAALYGGAMFIVARRYKRKRQGHRRTSSVSGSEASSEMQYAGNGSPAMMGGALMSQDMSSYGGVGNRERDSHGSGPSARTANISAPVATENSLGWN